MTSKREVGVGVIGAGYWGPKLLRNFQDAPGAELLAACDLSEERLTDLRQRYPALRTMTDVRELIADRDIDAVVVATPIRTHYRLAMMALQAGKHVLVEKPIAASHDEACRLAAAADLAGRVLMVGHTYQYNPAVARLRELVSSGALGEVYYIDAARLNLGLFQRDINVIWDLAPHDLSILLHVLGERPVRVAAQAAAHVLDGVDDLAHLGLHFANGLTAHVRLSWLDPCKVRRVTVVGSRKMAVFDDTAADKLCIYDRRVALRSLAEPGGIAFEYHDGDVETPAVDPAEPLRLEVEHFLHCIRTGARPVSDGTVGAEVVRLLQAMDHSRADGGRWVDVTTVPDGVVVAPVAKTPPAGAMAAAIGSAAG